MSQSFRFNKPTSAPEITIIDANSKTVINRHKMPMLDDVAAEIEWSSANMLLTVGDRLSLWDISQRASINYITSAAITRTPFVLFSPDGRFFLIQEYNMSTQQYELILLRSTDLERERTMALNSHPIFWVWSDDGLFIALADNLLLKFDMHGQDDWKHQLPESLSVSLSPEGAQVLLIDQKFEASIYDLTTGTVLYSFDE